MSEGSEGRSRGWLFSLVCGLAAASVAVFGLTACSSDEGGSSGAADTGGQSGGGELGTVSVAILEGTPDAVPLQMGVDRGTFSKRGVDVEVKPTPSPQAIAPELASGQRDCAEIPYGSIAVAIQAGLPLEIVAPVDVGPAKGEEDTLQIVAPKSSGISSVEDLIGKSVALNTVGGESELRLRKVLDDAGLDYGEVDAVAIPLENMAPALRSGSVDAALMIPPWLNQFKEEDEGTVVSDTSQALQSESPFFGIACSKQAVEGDPELMAEFRAGVEEANEFAAENPKELQSSFAKYMKVPAAVAETLVVKPSGELDPPKIQRVVDLLAEYELLPKPVDMESYVFEPEI